MTTIDPRLTDHAVRLLVGTGLDLATALAAAQGIAAVPGPVAVALRDGWDAAEAGEHQ